MDKGIVYPAGTDPCLLTVANKSSDTKDGKTIENLPAIQERKDGKSIENLPTIEERKKAQSIIDYIFGEGELPPEVIARFERRLQEELSDARDKTNQNKTPKINDLDELFTFPPLKHQSDNAQSRNKIIQMKQSTPDNTNEAWEQRPSYVELWKQHSRHVKKNPEINLRNKTKQDNLDEMNESWGKRPEWYVELWKKQLISAEESSKLDLRNDTKPTKPLTIEKMNIGKEQKPEWNDETSKQNVMTENSRKTINKMKWEPSHESYDELSEQYVMPVDARNEIKQIKYLTLDDINKGGEQSSDSYEKLSKQNVKENPKIGTKDIISTLKKKDSNSPEYSLNSKLTEEEEALVNEIENLNIQHRIPCLINNFSSSDGSTTNNQDSSKANISKNKNPYERNSKNQKDKSKSNQFQHDPILSEADENNEKFKYDFVTEPYKISNKSESSINNQASTEAIRNINPNELSLKSQQDQSKSDSRASVDEKNRSEMKQKSQQDQSKSNSQASVDEKNKSGTKQNYEKFKYDPEKGDYTTSNESGSSNKDNQPCVNEKPKQKYEKFKYDPEKGEYTTSNESGSSKNNQPPSKVTISKNNNPNELNLKSQQDQSKSDSQASVDEKNRSGTKQNYEQFKYDPEKGDYTTSNESGSSNKDNKPCVNEKPKQKYEKFKYDPEKGEYTTSNESGSSKNNQPPSKVTISKNNNPNEQKFMNQQDESKSDNQAFFNIAGMQQNYEKFKYDPAKEQYTTLNESDLTNIKEPQNSNERTTQSTRDQFDHDKMLPRPDNKIENPVKPNFVSTAEDNTNILQGKTPDYNNITEQNYKPTDLGHEEQPYYNATNQSDQSLTENNSQSQTGNKKELLDKQDSSEKSAKYTRDQFEHDKMLPRPDNKVEVKSVSKPEDNSSNLNDPSYPNNPAYPYAWQQQSNTSPYNYPNDSVGTYIEGSGKYHPSYYYSPNPNVDPKNSNYVPYYPWDPDGYQFPDANNNSGSNQPKKKKKEAPKPTPQKIAEIIEKTSKDKSEDDKNK